MEIRKYRIAGIALFDLVLGVIGTILLFVMLQKWHFPHMNVWYFVIAGILLTIPIGIVFHIIFGVNTTLNYRIGLSNKP